jgi:hypothetical protein
MRRSFKIAEDVFVREARFRKSVFVYNLYLRPVELGLNFLPAGGELFELFFIFFI